MSDRKQSPSLKSIKETVDDESYKLFAFIAINDTGCKQICYGAVNRADLIMIIGELQIMIADIHQRLSDNEKMDRLEAILQEAKQSIEEGDDDVRVLN